MRDETLDAIRATDATLFGAIGGEAYDEISRSVSTAEMGDAVLTELDRLVQS